MLATTRINFYDSDDVSKRKLLAFGSHTKAVNKSWEAAGGVSSDNITLQRTWLDGFSLSKLETRQILARRRNGDWIM